MTTGFQMLPIAALESHACDAAMNGSTVRVEFAAKRLPRQPEMTVDPLAVSRYADVFSCTETWVSG